MLPNMTAMVLLIIAFSLLHALAYRHVIVKAKGVGENVDNGTSVKHVSAHNQAGMHGRLETENWNMTTQGVSQSYSPLCEQELQRFEDICSSQILKKDKIRPPPSAGMAKVIGDTTQALIEANRSIECITAVNDIKSGTTDRIRDGRVAQPFGKAIESWMPDWMPDWMPRSESRLDDECSMPGAWTGKMNKAPGFYPFFRENPDLCILHHQGKDASATRRQAAIFGFAMEKANCLLSCPEQIWKTAWNYGSLAYATYHAQADHLSHAVKKSITVPVFVGQNFGLTRPGSDSILYAYELGGFIQQNIDTNVGILDSRRLDTWNYPNSDINNGNRDLFKTFFEFMNFSPSSCLGLREIEIKMPGQVPIARFAMLGKNKQWQYHEDETISHGTFTCTLNSLFSGACRTRKFSGRPRPDTFDVACIDCNVANRSAGPSKEEIAACYAEIRRRRPKDRRN